MAIQVAVIDVRSHGLLLPERRAVEDLMQQ